MTQNNKGFSLVEMAVSVTIIGILISAVIAGKDMKHHLELQQVVDEIGNVTTAVQEFNNLYSAVPGDMYNAVATFGSSTADGDGDTVIETGTPNEELLFWQHMAEAGLIEGTYDGTTNGPAGRMEGPLKYSLYGAHTTGGLLNISISKYLSGSGSGYGLFTPKESFEYDTKFDDSDPATGSIRASDGTGETAGDCVDTGEYNLANNSETPCVINFYIEQE